MKQIMFYVHPRQWFDEYGEALLKVQIDNSLYLGWKAEDIILGTNFNYSYQGISSTELPDEVFCEHNPVSTKVPALLALFDQGMIDQGEMYWMHDLDAFQLMPITEKEIGLNGVDMALCDYGRRPKWEGGNIFLKHSCQDIFDRVNVRMREMQAVDEDALFAMTSEDEVLRNRIKRLNISYSFKPFNLRSCYRMAKKPIRVAHFNPLEGRPRLQIPKLLDFYKGYNKINTVLIPDRLVKLFWEHDIR